jgi:hypothetical protein
VYKVAHVGDSRGDEWYTEVVGVGQYGKMPVLLNSVFDTMD